MNEGITTLDRYISRESGKLFSTFRAQRRGLPCPECGAPMKREHYAQGMAVYGCPTCNRCFMRHGKGWVELAFGYEDFFGGEEE
jgi:transposase-like protein